jgi:hypothetical protein
VKFKGAEVMTGRRSTIRQARLWARLLAPIAPGPQPDDVVLHMGAPPRWRALFGRAVLRCYRAELARAARAVEQAA